MPRPIPSVDRLVRESCAQFSSRPFLHDAEDGRCFTFGEFDEQISRAANVLRELGIGKGDVVSLFLRNSPEFFPCWLGAIRLGAISNPINLGLEHNLERVLYMLRQSGSRLLIIEAAFAQLAAEVHATLPELPIVFIDALDGSALDWQAALTKASPTIPVVETGPDEPFQMIFTSGTTGLPKAVVQHHAMVADGFALVEDHFGLGGDDVCQCVLPFFHVNAQYTSFFPMLGTGGQLVLFEKFSASRFFPTVRKYGVTYISVVPSLLTRLLSAGLPEDRSLYASLKFIVCGAAPLTAQLHREFVEKSGIPVANGWGMTETGCWGCHMDPAKPVWGAMGKPLAINEMKIVDSDTGRPLPTNHTGSLLVRGPNVFREYFQAPEATHKAFRFGGGWFDTGDDALVDKNGMFWFVGRGSVDTGKVDGEFVNFLSLDSRLWELPGVSEVCCVGVPDPIRGQVVCACIVKEPSATLDDAAVMAWATEAGLAYYEMPRHVLFVQEIPKGDTGKIQRRVMTEQATAALGL
ncbi:MAG: acyl--CoA ligase [Candidatus Cloacimonetes bacterium]|nr:acyl--CoA ligase [Candidatus Cloacimonadota bacterium]